ncbi:sulfatase-like hydrolase/transferase [Bacteroides thetaiotaomicron]|uniref:sulfatase-like hydrolase/transferase n=1 Tax=Bacteroides thetaiotaomicron TaxID=818 RepID=UPI0039C3588E
MKTLRLTYQLVAIPAALSFSACHTQSSQQQPTPPNIIYILADDMGYGDINAFNPHSQIPTPTLDSMASAGIMFTDAHSNSSVSTPTRYGTLTGRYAFRSSLKKGVLTGYSSSLIEKGRETIASFLSNQGYQTACIGKWHLGLDWVKKDAKKPLFTGNEWNVENTDNVDYTAYISGGPTDCGFGYSCILPASLDMPPYIYIEDGKVTAPVNGYTEDYLEKKNKRCPLSTWRRSRRLQSSRMPLLLHPKVRRIHSPCLQERHSLFPLSRTDSPPTPHGCREKNSKDAPLPELTATLSV